MKANITADIIIMFLLMGLTGLFFMAFMCRLENKKYFSAGTYLAGIIAISAMIVNFIVNNINN